MCTIRRTKRNIKKIFKAKRDFLRVCECERNGKDNDKKKRRSRNKNSRINSLDTVKTL